MLKKPSKKELFGQHFYSKKHKKLAILKACIFDLDGVLVDTAKYHFLAWKRLAKELEIDFQEHHNEQLKGISRMDSLDIILGIGDVTLNPEKKLELATKKNDWYVEYILEMNAEEILPGVLELLQELRQNDIKIALGSSSKNAATILDICDIRKYFDAIVDGTHISNSKPHPEVFLLGAEKLAMRAENCVVFEDAEAGVEAAINAGMKSIGVGPADSLGAADIVIDSLDGFGLEKIRSIMN